MRSSGENLVTIGIIVPPSQPSVQPQHEGDCPDDGQGVGARRRGAHGFPGGFGEGDGTGEAVWSVWRESSSAPKKKEVAVVL